MKMEVDLGSGRVSPRISANLPTSTLRSRECSAGDPDPRQPVRASPLRRKAQPFQVSLAASYACDPADETLDTMTRTRAPRRQAGFLKRHALSLTAIGILLSWVALYVYADPKTHRGSF